MEIEIMFMFFILIIHCLNNAFFPEQCYNSAMHVWIIAVNVKQMDKIIPTI